MAREEKVYRTVYFSNNDINMLHRFDDFYNVGQGGTRNPRILEAMEMLMAVDGQLDNINMDLDPGVPKRSYVRQALLTQARYEAGELIEADD